MLAAGQSQVADHVQAVPATGGPPVDHADDDLGHEADEPLHFQDVQSAGARRVDGLGGFTRGVLVAAAAADTLIAARAEGPSAVLGDGPFPVSNTTPTSGDIRAWSRAR